MAIEELDDLQAEAPPAKRARLERLEDDAAIANDDMDDIYNTGKNTPAQDVPVKPIVEAIPPVVMETSITSSGSIPGLWLLGQSLDISQKSAPEDSAASKMHSNSAKSLPNYKMDPRSIPVDHVSEALHQKTEPLEVRAPENKSSGTHGLGSGESDVQLLQAEAPEAQASDNVMQTDDGETQPVTSALEALLGGITPPAHLAGVNLCVDSKEDKAEDQILDTEITSCGFEINPATPYYPLAEPTPAEAEVMALVQRDPQGDMIANVSHDDLQETEWEVDSSPIQSSSEENDSDDSSSSGDSDEEDTYKLLDPEEQARILMEGDGGSDDEGAGGKGAKGSGVQLRTKNEVPEEVVPKPDVTITEDMKIEELGEVEAVVENIVLIKAKVSGEYRVLESGSVLCLANRSVIGVVSETLGRVQQPRYAVRFTNAEEIAGAGLEKRTNVYYSEKHSTYVFTQVLKAYRGSDASNLHDEEVGDEEIEFSDDEAEAEHRKRIKQKKMERRGGRAQQSGGTNRGHPLQQQYTPKQESPYDPAVGLNYDDEDNGPYKPLARPAGFAESIGRTEAPQESMEHAGRIHRSGKEGNSSPHQAREPYGRGGGFRGRGDRGRGNDRGRGRGNFQGRGGFQPRNEGFSQPPLNGGYSHSAQGSPMSPTFLPQDQCSPLQPHFQPPPYPQMPYNQQQYQYQQSHLPVLSPPPQQQQPSWPSLPMAQGGTQLPAGAYINPAFFGTQTQHQSPGQQLVPPAGHLPQQQQQQWGAPQPYQQFQHQSPEAERAFHEAQERLNILRNLSGGGRGY